MLFSLEVTFKQDSLLFKKFDSFRKKFDVNYQHCMALRLPILPKFELMSNCIQNLDELLSEDLENQFFELNSLFQISFSKIDLQKSNSERISLSPVISEELFFFTQATEQTILSCDGNFKISKKNSFEPQLLLGRASKLSQYHLALNELKDTFTFPLTLTAANLVLIEHKNGTKLVKRKLFDFNQALTNFNFDQTDEGNLTWEVC